MNNSRRKFIKQSSMALAGAALISNKMFASANADSHIVGIQLYSVRDDMKKAPLDTLKQIAGMGYKNVEHANYVDRKFYGYSANEFKKVLDGLGLNMPSGHTVMSGEHWDTATKTGDRDQPQHQIGMQPEHLVTSAGGFGARSGQRLRRTQ